MIIEIMLGLAAGFLCGALQSALLDRMLRFMKYRWLIFSGKLIIYILVFVAMLLYSTAALISCAVGATLSLWGTAIVRYMRKKY